MFARFASSCDPQPGPPPRSLWLLLAVVSADAQRASTRRRITLPKDLRARVERLKRDVAAAPTTAANVESRAAVLWEWTNAFALAGGMVPVNLTTVPAAVARARAAKQPIPEDSLGELDRYVRELAIKDADPNAIGPLTVSPAGPLPAASLATIEQTYTVGTLAMKEGGVVLIAQAAQRRPGPHAAPGSQGRELREHPLVTRRRSVGGDRGAARRDARRVSGRRADAGVPTVGGARWSKATL